MALKGIKTNTQKQNVKQGTKNEPQIVNVEKNYGIGKLPLVIIIIN